MTDKQFQSVAPTGEIAEGHPPIPMPEIDQIPDRMQNIRKKEPAFMDVFFAWEKLRLIYNGLLIKVVLTLVVRAGVSPLASIFFALHALAANLCFCAGPVAEGYLCWVGVPRQSSRWVVFCFGCVLAIVLTIEAVPGVLKMIKHDR